MKIPRHLSRICLLTFIIAATVFFSWPESRKGAQTQAALPTILFVTQPPFGGDFASTNAVFGNHIASTGQTPRGGDLYIRYSDGTLRNLTAEAGLGIKAGEEIAVREPSVHWSGAKALVSIVTGGTTKNDLHPVYWQMYEVTGIGKGETIRFRKLSQPSDYNNISPLYGTDDRILFTSDRPHNGSRRLYPQLDEYESTATNTGIWSMKADGSDLKLLDHAVSGDFTPIIDSFGRVIFTRWDHLQRDQQNNEGTLDLGAFNYASESSDEQLSTNTEIFPELRRQVSGSNLHGHTINQFFPWMMNEDGTGLETLNHIGRHELLSWFNSSRDGLPEFIPASARRTATNLLQLKEDPQRPGYYYGTRAPEFGTHASGQIIGLYGAPSVVADNMQVDYITDPVTYSVLPDGTPTQNLPGHYRNPLPLSNGSLIAVQTTSPYDDEPSGSPLSSRYDFRLVRLRAGTPYWTTAERIIPGGITKAISYFDNQTYQQLSYHGQMWELDPVEVRVRTIPQKHTDPLPDIEKQILSEEMGGQAGIDRFKTFLESRNLALVVSRDVTRRADKQQDFNLKIFGSSKQTAEAGAVPVEVAYMQFFQGDLIRGYSNFGPGGRRPLAQVMHDGLTTNIAGAPAGSVQLGSDGSMAALVPARRALSWQMTKANGEPVVRERYWMTFAPGEMRSCANCHGVTPTDVVLKQTIPTNPPQALRDLARWMKTSYPKAGVSGHAASVSAASYQGSEIACEEIASAFGANLATGRQLASSLPLPVSLNGTSITIKDSAGIEHLAPLFFVSPGQINYLIPKEASLGTATLTINSGDGAIASGTVSITSVHPGLFTADASGSGLPAAFILRTSGNSQSIEAIMRYDTSQQKFLPIAIDLGSTNDQVFLVLFGTGLRNRSSQANVTVRIGGVNADVAFAGAQGTMSGLDQVNARIPRSLIGHGETEVVLTVDGKQANSVKVQIK
jgi:uncharacterized protein (TIGR03437 family)